MRVSVLTSALILAAGLYAAAAEVGLDSTPASSKELTRICESARLTDLERRECRAMFKTAASDSDRAAAYRTFYERINGALAR